MLAFLAAGNAKLRRSSRLVRLGSAFLLLLPQGLPLGGIFFPAPQLLLLFCFLGAVSRGAFLPIVRLHSHRWAISIFEAENSVIRRTVAPESPLEHTRTPDVDEIITTSVVPAAYASLKRTRRCRFSSHSASQIADRADRNVKGDFSSRPSTLR